MIRNIVFDMGGVCIRFDPRAFIRRFGVSPEDEEILINEVYRSIEWAMMDRGRLQDEEAAKILSERLPARLSDTVHKLVTNWDRPILPIDGMEELVRELKENGYHLFLLSNASTRQPEYWKKVPFADCFEDTLISANVKLVKPMPEIYLEAYDRFHILPQESIFIDDTPANCEASQYTGMKAFVFNNDVQALRRFLCAQGVSVSG